MASEPLVGIYLQATFPLPGWYLRDMGVAGWKAHLDWAKATGFNACMFSPHVQFRLDDPQWSLPERRRLYHGLLAPRPPFGPGDIYYEKDPLMCSAETQRHVAVRQETARYSRHIGMHTVVGLKMNIASPTFAREHPHLQAVTPDDFVNEGLPLCPSKPNAVDHILDLWGSVVDTYPEVDGFALWGRDSGGCECEACQAKDNMFLEMVEMFYRMIKGKNPNSIVYLVSWGYEAHEIPPLARGLPKDIVAMEPPGLHYPGRRAKEEHVERIRSWVDSGIKVQSWVETQENPTYLLPAVYPKRVADILECERDAGVDGMWATSTMNAFVFALNHYVFAQMAGDPGKSGKEATRDCLVGTFGNEALVSGTVWVEALEDVWTRLYDSTQRASFGIPLHTVFPASLFPVPLMNEPAPDQLIEDIDVTVKSAERAVEAVEAMAETGAWRHHPLDTNVAVVSTKLICLRVKFRQAKLPFLDAIRRGEVEEATQAFEDVTRLAQDMVDTAASAPNTYFLITHWTKLGLWPERLEAVRDHIPTLAYMKRIRGIFDDDPLGFYRPTKT